MSAPKRDLIFEWEGVREVEEEVRRGWKGEEEALVVRYPEAAHEFPREVKLEAYLWLDRGMKGTDTTGDGETAGQAHSHSTGRSW